MSKVIDLQCFPCIEYIKIISKSTHVKIEKCEHFQKSSFRNRYVVAGANGLTSLTVPVAGGREQKALITEIEIDRSGNWPLKHWRSITSAYRKAPFFDYYAADVESLVFNPENSLFSFNFFTLTGLCNILNIKTVFDFTSQYDVDQEDLDCRNALLPGNFQDDAENWKPKYSQVFEDKLGFQPNLSILDLLFCEGPNAKNLLEKNI